MDRRDRLKTGAGPAPFFRGKTAAHAKSEHLSSLSRELRTQLTSIVELSELINRETLAAATNPQHAGYAKDIARCGVQLLAVINDLFDL